jgi:hypothetical protein
MSTPVLVVGIARRGTDGQIYTPQSLDELEAIFAPSVCYTVDVPATGTSVTLPLPAWGSQIQVNSYYDGIFLASQLYGLAVSGTSVTFGSLGASGTYQFVYSPVPAEGDLVAAARELIRIGRPAPAVLRLPGEVGTLSLGGAILFTALDSGSWANDLSVTLGSLPSSGQRTLTVSGDAGLLATFSFSLAGDLAAQVNQAAACNQCPLTAYPLPASGDALSLVPGGTYPVTGGADAVMDADTLGSVLSGVEMDGLDSILLAGGVTWDAAQAVVDQLDDGYPTLVFLGDPIASGSAFADDASYAAAASGFPVVDPRLFYIPGFTSHFGDTADETLTISLAPTFAGLWLGTNGSPTNMPAQLSYISPEWSQDSLAALSGLAVVFNRFILNGLAPYWSGPTTGDDPVYTRLMVAVGSTLYAALAPFIGRGSYDYNDLTDTLAQALASIPNVRVSGYTIDNSVPEQLTITVNVIRYGELRTIGFQFETVQTNP